MKLHTPDKYVNPVSFCNRVGPSNILQPTSQNIGNDNYGLDTQ